MNDRQCPPNLTRNRNSNIWKLAGNCVSAANVIAALEYANAHHALFVICRNGYLNVERLIKAKKRFEQCLAEAPYCDPDTNDWHARWHRLNVFRELGYALGDLASLLPCSDEQVFALCRFTPMMAHRDAHRELVGGFSACVHSYYSEDEERGSEDHSQARRARVDQFVAYLALSRALAKLTQDESHCPFSLALAARVAWARAAIARTANEGQVSADVTSYTDEACVLAYRAGALNTEDAEVPALVADVAPLIHAWSEGAGRFPMTVHQCTN